MVNLLNLKKQPDPVIIEKIVVKKRSFLLETLKLITIIAISSSVIYIVSNAAVDTSKNKQNTPKPLITAQDRIAKYEDFLAHMPTELDKKDQRVLTKEIGDVIATLKLNNTTTSTPTLSKKLKNATSTLRMKNRNATSTKLTKEERKKIALSTEASRKERQDKRQKELKDNSNKAMLLFAKMQALNQLLHPEQDTLAPKMKLFTNISTTPISSDVLHTIVVANSTSTIQSILNGIQENKKSEIQSLMKTKMEKKQKELKEKMLLKRFEKTKIGTTTEEVVTSTTSTTVGVTSTSTEEVASSTPEQNATTTDEITEQATTTESVSTTPVE